MNKIKTVRMIFPSTRLWRPWEGVACAADVLWLGGDRYQMKDVSLFVPLCFDDEFVGELRPAAGNDFDQLLVMRRTRKSGYRRDSLLASPEDVKGRLAPAFRMLREAGGSWCWELGGFVVMAVPPGFDMEAFEQLIRDCSAS